MVQKLVGRDDADAEFPGFRKQGVDRAVKSDEVLDLIAVEREKLSPTPGEQGVLYFGEEQTAQGGGVLAEPAFVEVEDYPVAPVDGIDKEKVERCWPRMCRKCGSAVKAETLFSTASRNMFCIPSLAGL